MEKIYLYNTLTRRKEEFKPIKKDEAGIYTCGPTVYDYAHVGNLRAYIFADILKRTLLYNGYKVKHIINITDVGHLTSDADTGEDKLEKGAARQGKSVLEIARFYEEEFKKDIKLLNIKEPFRWTRATEHIQEQIDLIRKIEKNGYVYQTDQAVYFDVGKFSQKEDYTALSGQKLEDQAIGSREEVNVDPDKKHPADFVLWFKRVGKYKNHILHWDSPWGDGFPGWHIECSAMGQKYLSEHFDIHTGGIDHISVHHTNERAQNIAACGHPVVERWMHNEFVIVRGGDKMSKSKGNFLTLNSAIIKKGINPLAYRFAALGTHYRKPMEYSEESMASAQNGLDHLYNQARELKFGIANSESRIVNNDYKNKFLAAINDDLNTPKALSVVQEVLKSNLTPEEKLAAVLDFDKVLGLDLQSSLNQELPPEIVSLKEAREKARAEKNYEESDRLRQEIEAKGYMVEDTPSGMRVFKKG